MEKLPTAYLRFQAKLGQTGWVALGSVVERNPFFVGDRDHASASSATIHRQRFSINVAAGDGLDWDQGQQS